MIPQIKLDTSLSSPLPRGCVSEDLHMSPTSVSVSPELAWIFWTHGPNLVAQHHQCVSQKHHCATTTAANRESFEHYYEKEMYAFQWGPKIVNLYLSKSILFTFYYQKTVFFLSAPPPTCVSVCQLWSLLLYSHHSQVLWPRGSE